MLQQKFFTNISQVTIVAESIVTAHCYQCSGGNCVCEKYLRSCVHPHLRFKNFTEIWFQIKFYPEGCSFQRHSSNQQN